MNLHEFVELLEKLVSSGTAALAVVCIVAYYQTRELRACRARDADCARQLTRARVAIARLYSIVKARLGQADAIPSLDELLSDRRAASDNH